MPLACPRLESVKQNFLSTATAQAQGGDVTHEDGTGGASIYGPRFEDESLLGTHDRAGVRCHKAPPIAFIRRVSLLVWARNTLDVQSLYYLADSIGSCGVVFCILFGIGTRGPAGTLPSA